MKHTKKFIRYRRYMWRAAMNWVIGDFIDRALLSSPGWEYIQAKYASREI